MSPALLDLLVYGASATLALLGATIVLAGAIEWVTER